MSGNVRVVVADKRGTGEGRGEYQFRAEVVILGVPFVYYGSSASFGCTSKKDAQKFAAQIAQELGVQVEDQAR